MSVDCRKIGTMCENSLSCNMKTGNCEPYDLNICDNQKNFSNALYYALKDVRKREKKEITGALTVYLIIHLIFLFWGIVLAVKSQPPDNRVVHITLAIVFGPAYVIAYYLNNFN